MKKINVLFVLMVFTILAFQMQAQKFQGKVTIESSSDEGLSAVFTIKNHMVKMVTKTEEGTLTMITNKKTGDQIMLNDNGEEKTGFKQNTLKNNPALYQHLQEQNTSPQPNKSSAKIEVTTETKMIGEYECTKIIGKDETMEGEAWVAKDVELKMADLFPTTQFNKQEKNAYQRTFMGNGFIMEMKSKDLESGEETTMNATVEKMEIDDKAFNIPDGYEFTDLTNIQELMKEAAGNAEKLDEIRKAMMKARSGNN